MTAPDRALPPDGTTDVEAARERRDGSAPGLPLARGSVLLHIGPHKTGTTSVQSAFHIARRELSRRGIHYAGPDRHPVIAAQAAIEQPGRQGQRKHPIARWEALLAEIARNRAELVVLSSEWFADAGPDAIQRIIGELGADRVHVVVTLRPVVRVLPSQWQQYLAAGSTVGYTSWLESVFGPPAAVVTPTFWHRHRHDLLVKRWMSVVGAARITVVVVDDVDRRAVLRAFEMLTGLREGVLVAEPDRANRSFTAPEADLLREMNARLAAEIDDPNLRLNLGLYGAAAALRLREPGAREPRIETPAWALERAVEVGNEIVAGLQGSGVLVIGNLGSLIGAPEPEVGATDAVAGSPRAAAPDIDWPDIVGAAGMGALTAAGFARTRHDARARLERVSSERLVRVVWHRVRNAVRNRLEARRGGGSRSVGQAGAAVTSEAPSPEVAAALAGLAERMAGEGLPRTLYDSVVREEIGSELLRIEARGSRAEAAPWPRIGAAVVLAIVRASGLLAGATSAKRLPPPRARIETLEVARVSTPAMALELGRRAVAALLPSGSPPID